MRLTILTIITLSSILLFSGCKEKGHQEEFSKGVFENGEYINKFLGFKMDIPESWYVYNDEEMQKLERLRQNDGKLNQEGKELMEKGKVRSADLFMTQLYNPYTFDAILNPTLYINAERVDDIKVIKNAEDFMRLARKTSKRMVNTPLVFTEKARVELNGNRFDRHTLEKEEYGYKYKTTQFCEIMNGYAVLFTLNYAHDSDRKELIKCLSSLEYKE
jgi:hypothetical protein